MFDENHENQSNEYSKIWDRIWEPIVKDFIQIIEVNVEVIHTNKYITNKIKSCNNKFKTDIHDEGFPPEQTPCLTVCK